jgi:hypothetical protein
MSTSLPDIGQVTTSQVDGLEIRPELKERASTFNANH